MFLSSLFSKKSDPFTVSDKVWMTEEEAWRGLATEAMKAITQGEIPIVISFFEDSKSRFIAFLSNAGIPLVDCEKGIAFEIDEKKKSIFCVEANYAERMLQQTDLKKYKLVILLDGHYPLISVENKILNDIYVAAGVKSFVFCFSLDSPLMQNFGSERMKSLMESLGIKKDECVEHAMVSKSITRAREKISESVRTEHHTNSEKEWFERNVKKN